MAKLSKKDIDYIFDNIDIVSLVSEYVKLEKRGQNYLGLCPFHNEKTPSFTVSPEKRIAHCFGCGKGGNIFQFLSLIENITYNQAIVKLGTRLGLDIESNDNKEVSYDLNNKLDSMYYGHLLLADYYNYILLNTKEAQGALNYLIDRGLSIETIKHFRPIGAIMLNITPDHLARHKTMENYIAAKERIFENQLSTDFMVLNIDDPIVADMKHRAPSHILEISQHQVVSNGAYYDKGQCYVTKNGTATPVIGSADIHIPGSHNIENILTVIALAYALGVPVETIHRIISEFHGVEHRLERVKTLDGITFYNDSKATNVDSVVKALESFDQSVILLAGGHDKMTPLEDFMQLVKDHTKAVIFMGEAADRFEAAAKEAGVQPIYRASSMKDAVEQGYKLATQGDIVLLSPACSSFDWYSCFEERGDDFKNCVHMLQEGRHH